MNQALHQFFKDRTLERVKEKQLNIRIWSRIFSEQPPIQNPLIRPHLLSRLRFYLMMKMYRLRIKLGVPLFDIFVTLTGLAISILVISCYWSCATPSISTAQARYELVYSSI